MSNKITVEELQALVDKINKELGGNEVVRLGKYTALIERDETREYQRKVRELSDRLRKEERER